MSTPMGHFAACVMKVMHYLMMEGLAQTLMSVQPAHMDASTFVKTLLEDLHVSVVKDIS